MSWSRTSRGPSFSLRCCLLLDISPCGRLSFCLRNHANQQAFLLFWHCLFSFLSQKRRVTPPSISPHGALSLCRPREAWASGISPQGALALLDGAQAIWHFSSQNTVSLSEMKTLPRSLSPQSTLCLRCYLSVCLSVIRHFSSWRAVYLRKHADQKTFLLFQRCISIAASSLAFHIMENYLPV